MGNIRKILNWVTSPKIDYQPLIEVRIFKDAILHNLREYQNKYTTIKFAPVLKSNAYGHGLVEVAETLDGKSLPFFIVDSFYEALILRHAAIKTKILILGYCREKQLLDNNFKDVSFGIIDIEVLKNLSVKARKKTDIHLKIDTGMHRQGILPEQIDEAIRLIKNNRNLTLEGICSHLADADGSNQDFTKQQIKQWNLIAEKFKKEFSNIKYFHLTNTAGSYFAPEANINVGRLGIGLYGINTSSFEKLNLQPTLEMASIVSSVKTIGIGEKVGYGITYQTSATAKVATVPAGYNEGVDRRLSNVGFFKIGNRECPIIGRVSMNITSIDITAISNVNLEQEVIIFSRNPQDKNSVENVAKFCGCIPYEILVHIPQHLRRVII